MYGDAELALRARALLGERHQVAAAAAVSAAGIRVCSWGASLDADYEIGSISKGITGLLYAEGLRRGEIDEATTLSECLPVLMGSAVRDVPLAAAAIHRSGLRTLPSSQSMLRTTVGVWRHGRNPYGGTCAELLEVARHEQPGNPTPRYSNLAFQLLGHAVAAVADTDYAGLVRERVARPLGLTNLYTPTTLMALRTTALTGTTRSGRPRPPWLGEALAPAGGIRATVSDMATLISALIDGTAPGIHALEPRAPFGRRSRIGAAWITSEYNNRHITWHNGGTGGFRSWAGIDRDAGTGVVVLTATHRSVDHAGFTLLEQITDDGNGTASREPATT